jgi:hypothetical protein
MTRSFPPALNGTNLVTLLAGALVLTGCNEPPAVNPWADDSIGRQEWTTHSEQEVVAANRAPVIRERDMPATLAPMANNEVPHYPLWWEDPFEDKGDGDETFAWTYADYLGMPYSLGRYILNTIAWPVSAVVTPPGTSMVSNGALSPGGLGCDHDAKVGVSCNPMATPTDFGYSEGETLSVQPTTAPAAG